MRNARRIDANITLGIVPDSDDFTHLKDLGYRTLVDVREEEEKFGSPIQQTAEALGFNYVSIPVSRKDIMLADVLLFYSVVYNKNNTPVYVFSRFGKKPLAFLLLFEAVANGESLVRVFQRASRIGIDLRGDLCLESFLVDFFNKGCTEEIVEAIREYRPELLRVTEDKTVMICETAKAHLASCIQRHDREELLGQRGCTVWLTGLPSAGKSTTAFTLEEKLTKLGYLVYVLDSDNIRHGLCNDLGFSAAERAENIRRISQVAKLFCDAGFIVITSFISPYRRDRSFARDIHREAGLGFVEVFVDTPLNVCEKRDSRGLYKKARQGELLGFTGLDAPFEPPPEPEVVVRPEDSAPAEIAEQLVDHLKRNKFLSLRAYPVLR